MTSTQAAPPTSLLSDSCGDATATLRVTSRSTRLILAAFVLLTAVGTNQLFVLSGRTQNWFAWTIRPTLTAAFLGAGYGAGFVLVVSALRAKAWVDTRLAVTTVLVFASLTLIGTLQHIDQLHFHSPGLVARFAAWFWLFIYLAVPVALGAVTVRQSRRRGFDPPRAHPLPAALAVALSLQGVLLMLAGIALFVAPRRAATLWPWTLSPLGAVMIAAWLIAFGAAAIMALWERDLQRLRNGTIGYAFFGLLQLLATARFAGEVDWRSPSAAIYVAMMVSVTVTGLLGWRRASAIASRPARQRH